jgi:hypothetical protein
MLEALRKSLARLLPGRGRARTCEVRETIKETELNLGSGG